MLLNCCGSALRIAALPARTCPRSRQRARVPCPARSRRLRALPAPEHRGAGSEDWLGAAAVGMQAGCAASAAPAMCWEDEPGRAG